MASLTPEVEQFITYRRLGAPMSIYGPSTVLNVIGGLILTTFALFWMWMALSITNSPLLSPSMSAMVLFHQPLPTFPPDSSTFTVVRIVFPLFGLLLCGVGIWIILYAVYNRDMRAAICMYGVILARPSGIDSFYWQDVLTTFHKVQVTTSTSYNQSSGYATTRTTVRHIYTVHCHDGRKFIFKSPLARVQDLGEEIEVQVARMKQPQRQARAY